MRRSTALLALLAGPLCACSLVLDPEECTSDGDCAPGVCKDGICIGDNAPEGPDMALPDGAAPPADMGPMPPPDAAADAGPDDAATGDGTTGDMMPPPDMGPPDAHVPVGPVCAITSPLPADRLTNREMEGVTVQVTDADTPNDQLVVQLNGEALTLDEAGSATFIANLAEGDNRFDLQVQDELGHTCDDHIVVVADRTGPTIDREEPALDTTLTNQARVTVRACISDTHGVEMVRATVRGLAVDEADVRHDGHCLMPCGGECVELDVDLGDGDNPVTLRAFDPLGNASETDELTLTLDDTPPEITVDAPADGTAVSLRSIPLRGRVTEPGGDPHDIVVRATVTGPRPGDMRSDNTQPDAQGNYAFGALALFPGDNRIDVSATDVAGNADTVTLHVFVETEPPCVNITQPQNNAVVGAGNLQVCGHACATVSTVRLEVAGNPLDAQLQANGDWCGTVNLPNGGEYTIRAVATSRAGQTANTQVTVVSDATPPVVVIDTPHAGDCFGGATVTVTGRATDLESRINALRANPGNVDGGLRPNSTFQAAVPVAQGADQRITVTATNAAGLQGSATVDVDVDRTPPTFEFSFQDGAFVAADDGGRVQLDGRLRDALCGVGGNALSVDGRPVLVLEDGTFSARPVLGPGPHDVQFDGRDVVGNMTQVRRRVVVDANPPVVEVEAPAPGTATTADAIDVRVRVSDGESGVDAVTIGGVQAMLAQVNGNTIATARVPLADGDNSIAIDATDRVGLHGRATLHVLRDLDAPGVTVTSPQPGDAVESSLFVSGTAEDAPGGSGVASVTVNGVPAHLEADGHTWSIAGVMLAAGQNRVTVIATDRAGNESDVAEFDVQVRDFALVNPERAGLGVATGIAWVGSADLDGDGDLDLVALSGEADGVSATYLQQPDHTFIARSDAVSGLPEGGGVRGAAFGDFNIDGQADLVLGFADHVEVRLGRGNGNFERSGAPGSPEGIDVQGLVAADVDRNGMLDVLVLAGAQSTLLFGDGAGGFLDAQVPADLGLLDARDASAAVVFDLTGDRIQDAVLVGDALATFNKGGRDGLFVTADAGTSGFADEGAAGAVLVDADRDGDLDVFATGDAPRFYLASPANETWAVDDRGLVPAGPSPFAAAADFDGDTRDDLAVGGDDGLELWRNTAGGFVRTANATAGLPEVVVTGPLHATDLDGDGDIDLVVPTDEGLRLVRANRSVTANPFRFVRLNIRRSRAGQQGPTDAFGVYVTADYDANRTADRALVATLFGPTIISMAAAPAVDLVAHFIDKGNMGGDRRNLDGREAGASETVNALE